MKPGTEKSKTMTNSVNDISVAICMNGQKLEKATSFKYLGETLQKNGRNPHQDHVIDGSNGQIKQDLGKQHHELRKQVQVAQVTCHFRPPL